MREAKPLSLFPGRQRKSLLCREVADLLSVSPATVRNWVKTGQITRVTRSGRTLLFDADEINHLKSLIAAGDLRRLQNGRNKKAARGRTLPAELLSTVAYQDLAREILGLADSDLSETGIRRVLAEVALQLLVASGKLEKSGTSDLSLFESALQGELKLNALEGFLEPLLCPAMPPAEGSQIRLLRAINHLGVPYIPGEDLLGMLYLALQRIGNRNLSGAYYTPASTCDQIVSKSLGLLNVLMPRIVDPCCGSGSFLMKAFTILEEQLCSQGMSKLEAERVIVETCLRGYDIDPVAVALARLNLALMLENPTEALNECIRCCDSLTDLEGEFGKFDLVISNPPWGCYLSPQQLANVAKRYSTAAIGESAGLFAELALFLLKPEGILALVLPESVFQAKRHSGLRKLLLDRQLHEVAILKNHFSGVFAPSISLTLVNRPGDENSLVTVSDGSKGHKLPLRRLRNGEVTAINLRTTSEEASVLETMTAQADVKYLGGFSRFALGIVTGNNRRYILEHEIEGAEPIIRGRDVFRYGPVRGSSYIVFTPRDFSK